MPEPIDLRSDTVTLPPPEMRKAMYEAELGDDVYREDPTVNRLERRVAEILGKEAGLLVTSGTQGNILALLSHTRRGDEVIAGDESHILHYEVAGAAALAGAQLRAVPNEPDGSLTPAGLQATIRNPRDVHQPPTTVICLENTHNRRGGTVLDAAYTAGVRDLAHGHGAVLHLDGARLFNAAVALGVPARELAAPADSLSVCASKGLAAPVGSVLCGRQDFIDRARKWRKMLGGGMRQAGVLAAGALYAFEHMVDRLADDHALARTLAEGLAEIPGAGIDLDRVQTNIVILDVAKSGHTVAEVVEALARQGVLSVPFGTTTLRMVTHYGIERAHVDHAVRITAGVFREL